MNQDHLTEIKKVLEWYADKANYNMEISISGMILNPCLAIEDGGQRALMLLQRIKEWEVEEEKTNEDTQAELGSIGDGFREYLKSLIREVKRERNDGESVSDKEEDSARTLFYDPNEQEEIIDLRKPRHRR